MVDPRNLKVSTVSTSCPLMIRGSMVDLFILKSIIISLVFLTLSSRQFESHHSTSLLTSFILEDSSLFEIKPTRVESSEKLKSSTDEEDDRQSLVYNVKRRGDITQPWGAPVLRVIVSKKIPFTLRD